MFSGRWVGYRKGEKGEGSTKNQYHNPTPFPLTMLAALARVLLNKDGDGLRGRRRRLYLDDGVGEDEVRNEVNGRGRGGVCSCTRPPHALRAHPR